MARYYSRLRSVEEKRRARKAVLMLILAAGMIAAAALVGFKFLSQIFLFISSLNPKNQVAVKDDFIPPGPPQLFLPYEATNSATINVGGAGEPGSTVYVTDNGDSAGEAVAGEDGSFALTGVALTGGKNVFSAVAVDEAGNKSQAAASQVIYYLTQPPKLEISTPTEGQKFTGGDGFIEVKGTTDPNARITVNDRVVIVNGSGNFNYRLKLNDGDNMITIVASDRAGNAQREDLAVNYSSQ